MKVVYVLPFFLPDYVGGTEVYVWSLCKYLESIGIACEVLIPNYNSNTTITYLYDNIKVIKYAEPTKQTRLHRMGLASPDGVNYFCEYLKRSNPDVVHFHGINGNISITPNHIVKAKELGFKTVYTIHLVNDVCLATTLILNKKHLCDGVIRFETCAKCVLIHKNNAESISTFFAYTSNVLRSIRVDAGKLSGTLATAMSFASRIQQHKSELYKVVENCDKVVVLTDWYKKILLKNGIEASKLNHISQALPFIPSPEKKTLETVSFQYKSSLKIVFAGRIDPLKGVDLLLKAVNGIPEEDIEISIYGKHETNDYYKLCKELTFNKGNIHWRGILERQYIIESFKKHDILCLPSTSAEMSPLVIQEAFAAGIPVLASNVPGNTELIENGKNGLLFDFSSIEHLSDRITLLIQDRKLVKKMKENISEPASFNEVGKKYFDLYNSI